MAPMAALLLSKNQVFLPGSTLQVSGPPWPKVVRKVRMSPSTPSATNWRAFWWAFVRRWFWPIMRNLPLSRAAAAMASQSAKVVAMGFSQSTCLPALRAAMVSSAWAVLAAQMLTASMAGAASSASQVG